MADITYALKGPVKTFRTEAATFVLKDGQHVEGPRLLREEAWFNRDGNRTNLHPYQNGRLVGRIVMKFEGRKNVESINYDGNGRMLLRSVKLYDEAGLSQGSTTYGGNGTLRSTFSLKRNSRGHVVESTERNAAGVVLTQITHKYEGDERYISQYKYYHPDGLLKSEVVFTAP